MSASQVLVKNSILPVKKLPPDTSAPQNQSTKVYPSFYSTGIQTFGQNGHGWNPAYQQNITPIVPSST